MSKIEGKAVVECFDFVARISTELENMKDALANLFSEQLSKKVALPCVLAGEVDTDDRIGNGYDRSWVYTDSAYSFPLKGKGKGKKSVGRYLGFQISMSGEGINIPGNNEPLLHVFCWSYPIKFEDCYISFPWGDDDYKIIDDRLMLWAKPEADWNEREWNYSLRLLSINSIDDLKKYIVTPALALLKGEGTREALPDEWLNSVLARYPAEIKTGK